MNAKQGARIYAFAEAAGCAGVHAVNSASAGNKSAVMASAAARRLQIAGISTPLGELLLVFDACAQLYAAEWRDDASVAGSERMRVALARQARVIGAHVLDAVPATAIPATLRNAFDNYFSGAIDALQHVSCAVAGTAFQCIVWQALRGIAPGQTCSYRDLARDIGKPAAIRAVGTANGANPLSIVVPCHRVIGSDGALTGYGGGLERKRWLLEHEARNV